MLPEVVNEISVRSWSNVTSCRICGSVTNLIADLGNLALTSYFPPPGSEAPRIPLTLRHCPNCALVQTGENTEAWLMYREGYGYKSGINETMVRHLGGIVNLGAKYTKPGDFVLDIGCNDGTLLRLWEKYRVKRYGVDPIGEMVEGATIRREYFNGIDIQFDVITSIAMFYDLPNPVNFARNVAASLAPEGVWILEVGYAGALQKGLWDGICHEHLEYYGLTQIDRIEQIVGLNIMEFSFDETNGGSLRCVLGRGVRADLTATLDAERRWDWSDLQIDIGLSAKNIRSIIGGRRVYALGASTKGNTLLQTAWLDHRTIAAAVERNPEKIGKRTPGTNIPIISEEEARENPPQAFLVLPYHFKDQLLERYADLRAKGVKFIFPLPSVVEC